MRIGGLASGIDTESIINDMMRAHRIPLNKITQKKQYTEWQLDDYRSVNRDIRSMREGLFDMTRQSTYMAKTVNVSNENAVGIRALSANAEFSGTLQVHELARAATWNSGDANKLVSTEKDENGNEVKLSENTKISDLSEDSWLKVGDTIHISVPNGEKAEIEIKEDDTIKSLITRINKESGVNAFFDEQSGKIAMTAKESGINGDVKKISVGVAKKDEEEATPLEGADAQEGKNADFTFNGLRTERESNTFEINGFEITLKEPTDVAVTFSSATDVDKVFDSVMEFVNDYNELIEKLNGKVKEQKFRDFHPLSDEEKADMKEKEIELWEEKAMSGTLRNDPTIQGLLQSMRMTLSQGIEYGPEDENGRKPRLVLSEIGITTSKDFLANGKLEVDEDKLRAAIAEDPNKVYELLGGPGNEEEGKGQGIIRTLRSTMQTANDTIARRAGSAGAANESFTIGRNIKEMDSQIERFEERMKKMEERYWREFTAMEQAMSRAQSQAEQLMNALGGMMM